MNEDKSTRYQRLKRTITWIWLAVGAVAILILLPGGGAVRLRDAIVRTFGLTATSPLTVVLFATALVLLAEIAGLPITLYKRMLERRYAVPHLPLGRQMADDIKSLPVGVALVAAHAAAVYFVLARWPHWWWAIGAAIYALALVVLTAAAPVVTPWFYTCTPLARPALQGRLRLLASRAGIDRLSVDAWAADAGRRRVSAALVGVGSGRRVLIGETLLSDYTDDEIEVVVAHELGHHVHHDIRAGLVLRIAVAIAGFGAMASVLAASWRPLGFVAAHDAAGIPLLAMSGGLVMLAARPLVNALSRRQEYRADRFALALTGRADAFVSAIRRAAAQTLTETRPSTATLWLFHSHPTVEQRIRAARAFHP